MCWITLTPKHTSSHHHHHPRTSSAPGPSVEELVKVHQSAHKARYTKIGIATPSVSMTDHHHHHHHRHHLPHVHPLHMHPVFLPEHRHHHHNHHHHQHRSFHLHGTGKRRSTPPAPPPSSVSPREPNFRTQIVEPKVRPVRETTRIALRESQPEVRQRSRLRRVAGYEVLGSEVPWNWDCVSNPASSASDRTRRGSSGLKFPPFGGLERWM